MAEIFSFSEFLGTLQALESLKILCNVNSVFFRFLKNKVFREFKNPEAATFSHLRNRKNQKCLEIQF